MAARADVHVALGGPEDACGGGFISVDTKGHLRNVSLYGERFAQGDAEATLRWYDRRRGIAGADRRPALVRARQGAAAARGHRAGASGTVLGSASLRRGGALAANVMLQGVPLSRLDALGALASQVAGSVVGRRARVGQPRRLPARRGLRRSRRGRRLGRPCARRRRAGIAPRREHDPPDAPAEAKLRAYPLRRARSDLPSTRRRFSPIRRPTGSGPSTETSSATPRISMTSSSPGPELRTRRAGSPCAASTSAPSPESWRPGGRTPTTGRAPPRAPSAASSGRSSSSTTCRSIRRRRPRGRLILGPTFVTRGADKVTLSQLHDPIELADDALTVPALEVTLETGEARARGGLRLSRRLRADGRCQRRSPAIRPSPSTRASRRWTSPSCRASCRTSTARPASSKAACT